MVPVEVVPVGRHPLEAPAHALLEGFDLRQRRARDREQGDVALREVPVRAVDVVGQERAAWAALLPPRTEHEVIDDQLAAPVEQVGEGLLPVRPLEDVALLDPHPGQLAALGAQPIAQPGEFLLLAQELLARSEPVLARHKTVLHRVTPLLAVINRSIN